MTSNVYRFGKKRVQVLIELGICGCSTLCLVALTVMPLQQVYGQSPVPPEYHGDENWLAQGFMLGNLIKSSIVNWGVTGSSVRGAWPIEFNKHTDGLAVFILGEVHGDRTSTPMLREFYGGRPDTVLHPLVIRYRGYGTEIGPYGDIWGWLPLPGFHNPERVDLFTGELKPEPATSTDPRSWPEFWPDRRGNLDDPGWRGSWNGLFGRNVFNADWEVYYVMDDWQQREYMIDEQTGLPFSRFGVYYPDPADRTRGGMGLQVQVRALQWANPIAEDIMFLIFAINNVGQTNHDKLYFNNMINFYMPPEGDESAAFDPQLDISYGWDRNGIGLINGVAYPLGYTGEAFLESPVRSEDGLDNDEDGITDESRFGGPGTLIEGQAAIKSYVQANFNVDDFIRFYGEDGASTLDEVLEQRLPYQRGLWWTGDENLDWVGLEDENGNGVYDAGELLFNDVGLDGVGPNDLDYPGPDNGEGNNRPDCVIGQGCEPNFDLLDVDESDQIGLTGFDLGNRSFYSSGGNMIRDSWMWHRIVNVAQFPLGTDPQSVEDAGIEPLLVFASGPVALGPDRTDFFSLAWMFGVDQDDFLSNRRRAQRIYKADYQFATPPFAPTLTAIPGDGQVHLSWDAVPVRSFDRFSQRFDFEGFKLYKGTDENLSDALLVTNVFGTPVYRKPIAQWDLDNGIHGTVDAQFGELKYFLGSDTGLEFNYVDKDVTNGMTYYYALVAYDHADLDPEAGVVVPTVDPQENVFNFRLDRTGKVIEASKNAAIVTPQTLPAGQVAGSANEDLSSPSGTMSEAFADPLGTGSISVKLLDSDRAKLDHAYRLSFTSVPMNDANPVMYRTSGYKLEDLTTGETLEERSTELLEPTRVVDGFTVEMANHDIEIDLDRSGWRSKAGNTDEYSLNPGEVDGYATNWVATIEPPKNEFTASPYDFLLEWTDTPERIGPFPGGYISAELPITCRVLSTDTACALMVRDVNESGDYDPGDAISVYYTSGFLRPRRIRFAITFEPDGESIPPSPGDQFYVNQWRSFREGDYFDFTIRPASVDVERAADELDKIAVVPNPYVGASAFEPRSILTGRGERRVQFIHLPQTCTIRIFNLRGEVIRTLEHSGFSTQGALFWDLLTDGGQEIAFGTYFYHVDAPGIGETTGKFSIVK